MAHEFSTIDASLLNLRLNLSIKEAIRDVKRSE